MSDYDSNLDNLKCPFCDCLITKEIDKEGQLLEIDIYDDEDYNFYKCPICEKNIKIELEIYKTYEYLTSQPSEEEIKKHDLKDKDDSIEDVPGQTFMWED